MTILIAPDKFKGSLSAHEVANAITEALLTINPDINCIKLPLADGGDGTCILLTQATRGTLHSCPARDPLLRPIKTHYGIFLHSHSDFSAPYPHTHSHSPAAIIEMAAASGLSLLQPHEYNPLITSSAGTGDTILHAVTHHNITSLILGIGGTATNDGGIGMAAALGARFYSQEGQLLNPIAQNLNLIHHIDLSQVPGAIRNLRCTLLCDVDNPLFGPNGATAIFGPQKGATPEMIPVLDSGLRHLHDIIQTQFNLSVNFPGAGAAGGFPAMLTLLMPTEIHSGTEFITRITNLENHIRQADLIITGEGRVDTQTLSGKLISGIAALAARHAKPLIILAGTSLLTPEQLQTLNVHKLITLVDQETTAETALANPIPLIHHRITGNLSSVIHP